MNRAVSKTVVSVTPVPRVRIPPPPPEAHPMDAPASHHGTCRPEMKYSLRLSPPRFVNAKPMPAERTKYAATIAMAGAARRLVTLHPPDFALDLDELVGAAGAL